MLGNLSVLTIGVVMLASFEVAASDVSIGAGNPYPVSDYTCEDGTRLAVRLLGDRASVSVNGATAVDLPLMGPDGATYSNGRHTLTIRRLSVSVGQNMAGK